MSAFGVGGTNVHLIIESPPYAPAHPRSEQGRPQILPLSAIDEAALKRNADRLARYLSDESAPPLCDAAHTLQIGRRELSTRGFVLASDTEEAARALQAPLMAYQTPPSPLRVIFMFPGQGAQQPGMAAGIHHFGPVAAQWIERGLLRFQERTGEDIRSLLLDPSADADLLRETRVAQPALYIVGYAIAAQWMAIGVRPDAMVGHSVGEFVAATLAGVMSFEQALDLIIDRGRLMQSAPEGAMLSVRLPADALRDLNVPDIDIAAENAPALSVASGPPDAIAMLERELLAREVPHQRLHTSHAFHSRMMDGPAEELARAMSNGMSFQDPRIKIASSVTGAWAGVDMTKSDYWARHCRSPVLFSSALALAAADASVVCVEIGPGKALTTLAHQILRRDRLRTAIPSLPAPGASRGDRQMLNAIGLAWSHGCTIDWEALRGDTDASRISLPAYAFARDRHWIEASGAAPDSPQYIHPEEAPMIDRKKDISSTVRAILEEISGQTLPQDASRATFLELGFDSLSLGQVSLRLQRQLGVKIPFRKLLTDLTAIESLTAHIAAQVPQAPIPQSAAPNNPAPRAARTPLRAPGPPPGSPPLTSDLGSIFQSQLDAVRAVIDQQNTIIAGTRANLAAETTAFQAEPEAPDLSNSTFGTAPPVAAAQSDRFRLFRPGDESPALDARKQTFIHDLVKRWNAKTPGSKEYAQKHRGRLADPRSASGFRPEWKDLVYPIVVSRAKGAHLTDIDGNDYIDLVNGYGQTAFGHSPDFVQDALTRQIADGYPIGPQSPLAGEVAEMICEMVGAERATFCNTGSEAVMAAMRVARTVTGRDTIVTFANDYHGQFDEVLVRRGVRDAHALPSAPGVPAASVSNMVVLAYGAPESLDWIRANGDIVAAVLVEPVQSRHPELRPFDFLRSLRALTTDCGAALIFDEVVTGFRVHPGGIQAVADIRADMATYGKVLGGGMPVGILAGSRTFLDALDGGDWRFGDDSHPEVAPTFFAGTFVRHPLTLAACKATLLHMRESGSSLQDGLSSRSQALVARINKILETRGAPFEARGYASWFMIEPANADAFGTLFFHCLRLEGLHIQEGFPCFLTTAHGVREFDAIAVAFERAIDAVQSAGILCGPDGNATRAPRTRRAPLSPAQIEVLHAASLSDTASCAYNESIRIDLTGDLDKGALQGAFQAVIDRHEALRACISPTENMMITSGALEVRLQSEDLTEASDPQQELKRLTAEDAKKPFDLATAPLVRGRLFKTDPDRHTLIITAHHIVCDGWSMGVIVSELAEIYSAIIQRRAPSLSAPKPLSDVARNKADADSSILFWKRIHAQPAERLELPTDRPRRSARDYNGATATAHIEKSLLESTRVVGAAAGATLFTTLYTAFNVLLFRLTGQNDIVIGVPLAGQTALDDAPVVGHMVEFLPLRVPLDPARTFDDALRATQRHTNDAFDNRGATFGEIVRALGLHRDAQRPPLLDVQFNLERFGDVAGFANLSTSVRANPKAAVAFDLFFNLTESSGGLRLDVDYDRDLFDADTITRWVENFRVLLQSLAQHATTQPIAAADYVTPSEIAWLAAQTPDYLPIPEDHTIASAFTAVAARHSQRTALIEGDRRMTYAQLEAASNRFSRALVELGVRHRDRVALIASRGIDAIVAILGILRAGAIYVPLDPSHPIDRLHFMREDSEVRLTITQASETGAANHAYELAQLIKLSATCSAEPLPAAGGANAPAYVMYTSGSTGRPKGVVVTNRGVLRLVTRQSFMRFGPEEVILNFAPLAFDASTLEIWAGLLHGGTLAIVPHQQTDLISIETTIARHSATTAWFTSALFNAIIDDRPAALAPLKQILVGGDVVSPAHVRKAQAQLSAQIINGYGPTENTTFTACYAVPPLTGAETFIPIGRPLAGTRCHVVDTNRRRVGRGVVGELAVAGEGLAIGYLNRENATSEQFATLDVERGDRVYLTGDLVRWRNDGLLEFLGRKDGQVKLLGRRVELGEIENTLMGIPGVGEAGVIVRDGPSGSRWIEAFVTRTGPNLQDDTWIGHLRSKVSTMLPDEMRPRQIHALPALPRTSNGKLDRSALARLETSAAEIAGTRTSLSKAEQAIAAVWADVLGVEVRSPTDAPFSLGADSLQIFRIAARLSDAGLPIEVRDLLSNPTLRDLARLMDTPPESPGAKGVVPLSDFRRGRGRRK